ncbi:MAG: metallophosphoesterase [Gammaproteobacteria bacterium]|nr:metallophosphoesterase [Gammaproteobacteria bacterium]
MSSLHLLQITDTHLFADPLAVKNGVAPTSTLTSVLDEALCERSPDLILATGDLAQEPILNTYMAFVRLIRDRFNGPILGVPGNHDVGETMKKVISTSSVSMGDWRIITLDTHVDHEVAGHVGSEELDRLSTELKKPSKYFLVVGHHPLTDIGCGWLDAHRVDNGETVVELLEANPASTAYLCGHIHQVYDQVHNGIRYLATPSTCWQFAPNVDSFGFDNAPPGWRWLKLLDDGSIHTEVRRLGGAWN